MQNFSVGLSGLNAAYAALDIIGNNIANAATEGYHRQRAELVPAAYGNRNMLGIGGGVDASRVARIIDGLLEREILRQESSYGQVSQELSVLDAIETTFGEFGDEGGLNATIDAFFDALRGLAAHPLERVWRNETISSAQVLTSEFRRLGMSLVDMENQIVLEAQNTTNAMNLLIRQISELNGKIQTIEINGGQANNLRDHRDQLIMELGRLCSIETIPREYGVVDVSVAGLPVVAGAAPMELQSGLRSDQTLGISAAGDNAFALNVEGGKLGGLFTLRNGLLQGLSDSLDQLASAIVQQINIQHVQGLGLDGSFTELTGWAMPGNDLALAAAPISDGTFYIRLTNTTTGQVERHAIDVNMSAGTPDTLSTIAAKISAISGLTASTGSSRLHILTDLGYTFDFTPALLSAPTSTTFTAGSPPSVSISGLYDGDQNDNYTFVVAGSGSVGNGTLRLDVREGSGDVIGTYNIGLGYAAGDIIELSNGIKVAVGVGQLNDGDSFSVDAFATTDTSGFLVAAGMNTFFSGASASEMRVCSRVADSPDAIATAFGSDLTDNAAAKRLYAVQDRAVTSLGGMTPNEYYHRTLAGLGQEVALKRSRQENMEAMLSNLRKRQSDVSGVNINDEAAQLLVFEKMFQAVAKYMTSLQSTLVTLMDLV